MASFKLSKSKQTLMSGVSNAAGSSKNATVDLRDSHGGMLSIQLSNGATGPTIPAKVYIGVSYSTSSTPVASNTWGSDWFLMTTLSGTSTDNDTKNFPPIVIPAGACHILVWMGDNTGQPVTINAQMSVIDSVESI